jgi:hypothetical protein
MIKFESEKDLYNSLLVPFLLFLYRQKNAKFFLPKIRQLNRRILILSPKNQIARKNQNRHQFLELAQDVAKSKRAAIEKDLVDVASSRTYQITATLEKLTTKNSNKKKLLNNGILIFYFFF